MASRLLTDAEIEFARQVFEDRLPYKKIHITSYYLPGNQGVPVTLASAGSIIATRTRRNYTIYFGPDAYNDGAHAHDRRRLHPRADARLAGLPPQTLVGVHGRVDARAGSRHRHDGQPRRRVRLRAGRALGRLQRRAAGAHRAGLVQQRDEDATTRCTNTFRIISAPVGTERDAPAVLCLYRHTRETSEAAPPTRVRRRRGSPARSPAARS